jgi:hypothetical protein
VPLKEPCYFGFRTCSGTGALGSLWRLLPDRDQVDDLTFVVSSAGEVLLQVQNFPESLVRQAMGTLRVLPKHFIPMGNLILER